MIYTIVQIIVALIIIIIMGILAYGIYNKNAQEMILDATKFHSLKKKTKIIDGVFSYDTDKTATFNTTDETLGNYIDINPSINQKGGAVYSYNFWLFMPNASNVQNDKQTLILFNKGSNKTLKYASEFRCHTNTNTNGWFLVKNPLLRVNYKANKIDAVVVELNSISKPDVYHSGANIGELKCTGDYHNDYDQNLFGIKNLANRLDLHNKWNMITVVVSETTAEADSVFLSENQLIVKLYLNGYQYFDKNGEIVLSDGKNYSTAIRSNKGDLFLNPGSNKTGHTYIKTNDSSTAISDLTYFNYTLSDEEIINLFKEGCNKKTALLPNEITFNNLENEESKLELKGMDNPEAL